MSFKTHFKFPHLCWISSNNISISTTNYPIIISKNLFDHAMIYQWQTVIGIVPAAITPDFLIFSTLTCRVAKRDLGFNQGDIYFIISEQLAPAHSWTRSLLELHVHHCLGEPHHLLFPRLRGFLLLIATWRSRMVCLSLSTGIPGLELPEHEGLILSPNVQPLFGLFFLPFGLPLPFWQRHRRQQTCF